jgi:hypothetical protein
MNNEELKVLHSNNRIHVIEKEYNGALITVANAVNAPISFRIYSKDIQCKQMKLKSEGLNNFNETKIPFVGNAIELSDYTKANLIIGDKYYLSDYIEYNSQTNESFRYTVIDETVLNYNIPLKDQTQAIFFAPIVEKIEITEDNYCFNKIKTYQNECEISVVSDNQFVFEDFVKLGNYNEVINVISSEENTYQYLGNDNYLYYNSYFFCNCDYEFSYNTSGGESIIIRFYDEQNKNVSQEMIKIFNDGIYDNNNQGIVIETNEFKFLFDKESDINTYRFQIGFKVEQNKYFSAINFYKLTINNIYMDLQVKSLKETEFNLVEFSKNGKYLGREYTNALNAKEKIYQYLGDENYLYYHLFIPYNSNYRFSYEISNLSETVIRFYDNKKRNISDTFINNIADGYYDEEQKGIIINSTDIIIPYLEETDVVSFQLGFKVEQNSYFSNLELKKC